MKFKFGARILTFTVFGTRPLWMPPLVTLYVLHGNWLVFILLAD